MKFSADTAVAARINDDVGEDIWPIDAMAPDPGTAGGGAGSASVHPGRTGDRAVPRSAGRGPRLCVFPSVGRELSGQCRCPALIDDEPADTAIFHARRPKHGVEGAAGETGTWTAPRPGL